MTTQEQELTLFGGWAKVQTLRQIGYGVVKPLVTHSVSIFLREGGEDAVDAEKLGELFSVDYQFPKVHRFEVHDSDFSFYIRPNLRTLVKSGQAEKGMTVSYTTEESPLRVEAQRVVWHLKPGYGIPTQESETILTERPSAEEWKPTWSWIVHETMADHSVLRFFEIWNRGTAERFRSGFLGTERLLHTFAGKVGANNQKLPGGKGMLNRSDNGEWSVIDIKRLYPRLRHLPPEGIKSVRKLAYKLREQRQAKKANGF